MLIPLIVNHTKLLWKSA